MKDQVTAKLIVEGPDLVAALKAGYRQTEWESVLEITTEDDRVVTG